MAAGLESQLYQICSDPETLSEARELFNIARAKTGPGSGRVLGPKAVALPAICALLACEVCVTMHPSFILYLTRLKKSRYHRRHWENSSTNVMSGSKRFQICIFDCQKCDGCNSTETKVKDCKFWVSGWKLRSWRRCVQMDEESPSSSFTKRRAWWTSCGGERSYLYCLSLGLHFPSRKKCPRLSDYL